MNKVEQIGVKTLYSNFSRNAKQSIILTRILYIKEMGQNELQYLSILHFENWLWFPIKSNCYDFVATSCVVYKLILVCQSVMEMNSLFL